MSTRLNGQALFASFASGLVQSYSNVANSASTNAITQTQISEATSNNYYMNNSFSQYLNTNFTKFDTNKDGKIDSSEIQTSINQMSQQGMTYNELSQLYQTGAQNSLLDTVLTHFNEIDKNHDGRVTNAEIQTYGVDAEIEEKKTTYNSFDADSFSVFYGSDSSDDEDDSSLLDYKYSSTSSS